MTIWRLRIACCVPTATYTHSEYVTLTALPLQQWLHERSSTLRYTYIVFVLLMNNASACRTFQCWYSVVSPNRTDDAPYAVAQIFKLRATTCTNRPTQTLNRRKEIPRNWAIVHLQQSREQLAGLPVSSLVWNISISYLCTRNLYFLPSCFRFLLRHEIFQSLYTKIDRSKNYVTF